LIYKRMYGTPDEIRTHDLLLRRYTPDFFRFLGAEKIAGKSAVSSL